MIDQAQIESFRQNFIKEFANENYARFQAVRQKGVTQTGGLKMKHRPPQPQYLQDLKLYSCPLPLP